MNTVNHKFHILSYADLQPASPEDQTTVKIYKSCNYPHYEEVDLKNFRLDSFKNDYLPMQVDVIESQLADIQPAEYKAYQDAAAAAGQHKTPRKVGEDLSKSTFEAYQRKGNNIAGGDCLTLDWDSGIEGSLKDLDATFMAHGVSFCRINSRNHNIFKKKNNAGIAERAHYEFPLSYFRFNSERQRYQRKLERLIEETKQAQMKDASKCVDQNFSKEAQCIFGFVKNTTPEYTVFVGTRNIDTYLDDEYFKDRDLSFVEEPAAKERQKQKKQQQEAPIKAEAPASMQASRPALKTIQPPVIRPAYKTGVTDEKGYSQKTLIEALNQIDPRVFNTRSDTGLYEKLHVELMLKNDPAKFRDATSTYLALISGAASAGIPLEEVERWADRDPDYCTEADASSRRANYLAYSGQHKETFFKIYHAYCRAYQQDDILNKETEANDRLQCWTDRGFRPSFMPFERDADGKLKQSKSKLTTSEVVSFMEALSSTEDTELYFDIGSNSRVCKSKVFSFDNERGAEAFIYQMLFEKLGYKDIGERALKQAFTRYFDTHKDNSFSRFLSRRGICANNWDGVPRVDGLFTDALGLETDGAQTADYLKSVSRYFFTGMLELSHYSALKGTAPKVEIMPVFQSDAGGVGKNTLINALTFDTETAGDFHTTIDPYDFVTKSPRDIYLDCAGCVLAELGDVPFGKVDIVRKLKYKLSEQSTKYSVKFEMFNTKGIRHFMYVATTNDRECLNVTYGGVERRFAVVTFDHDVIDAINQKVIPNIDQLYCEAMHIYETQGGLQYKELDEILKGGSIAEEHSITAGEEAEINLIIDREECSQIVADPQLKEVHIHTASIMNELVQSAETRRVSKQIIWKVLKDRGYIRNTKSQRIRRYVWGVYPYGDIVRTSDPCRVWTRKVKAEERQGIRARAEDYRQQQLPTQQQGYTGIAGDFRYE